MAAVLFTGMLLSRIFVIGPLGFAIGFVMAAAQSFVDGAPNAEIAVRALLWLWVIVVYPIALTVVLNQVVLPTHPASAAGQKPAAPAKVKKPIFVPDLCTTLPHSHLALKVPLAP